MRDFPVFKTKIEGKDKKFNFSDPKEVSEYYEYKAGEEIAKIRQYLEKNTFVAYLLGKKNAGKGTYTKQFMSIFGSDKVAHISVGDLVRVVDEEMKDPKKKEELVSYLKRNYRGYHSLDEILKAQEERGITKPLLPTEYVLALLKREIGRIGKKALFIDGLPRNLDQVSYSLFFRDLIGFRDDPDFFVLIQIAESIIDARMRGRVVCPVCHTPRHPKLLVTSEAGYDKDAGEFYLKCDNDGCWKARMVPKEGDELGIEPIRERLALDGELIDKAFSLHGVPKVLLRNNVPVKEAGEMVDDYEATPEFILKYDKKTEDVTVSQRPWVVKDDHGVDSYSLMPQAVTLAMIKQIADVLGL
jgi:adenylate kinase family enzyme